MMRVLYSCGGCDATTEAPVPPRKFVSLTGRGYGFGHWEYPAIEDIAPDGWIAFDPYTGCTYCPDCWADIMATTENQGEAAGP